MKKNKRGKIKKWERKKVKKKEKINVISIASIF